MSGLWTVALDAMGGDHGVDTVVPAALAALRNREGLEIILVGDESAIREAMTRAGAGEQPRLTVRHASQTVAMDEPPAQALRLKKDSSMRVAINLVKEGVAHACVSAGNTGALLATARYVLKTLPGIDRPAISTALPAIKGRTHMLDLGANIDCTAEHLYQFAVMGSSLVSAIEGIPNPRIGLLNIGEEDIKGNDQVREAARLLEASPLNYIGFVEGDDIFCGDVDVVVCDGFVGNVSLKTSEGVAHMVAHELRAEFMRSPLTRLAGIIARPVINAFRRRYDPRRYNGASLLGLQGIVIKSHGGADAVAFENAIDIACIEAEKGVPARIDKEIERLLIRQGGA